MNREGAKRSNHQLLMRTLTIKLRKTEMKEDNGTRIDATKLKVVQTKAAF